VAAPADIEPAVSQPAEVPSPISSSEHFAIRLRETVVPLFLSANLSRPLPQIDTAAYQIYRDRLLADCGSPSDPIEVMIIEQLALAHINTGLLHCRAANSGSVEGASVYLGAAARLMAEFRRSALALQAYRAAARQLEHKAETGPVVVIDGAAGIEGGPEKPGDDIEQGLCPETDDADVPVILPFCRSATV
jgi:hypothetical protein